MEKHILISGGTGFLGAYITPLLLKDKDTYLHLLTRHPRQDTERIKYIQGDVTYKNLLTDEGKITELSDKITHGLHMAASTSFRESEREETREMNVGGTGHFIDFIKKCKNLVLPCHVSTLYINQGMEIAKEDAIPPTTHLANPYEKTKHKAEILWKESDLPHASFRTGIFSGDSQTGNTNGDSRMGYGVLIGILKAISRDPKIGGMENYWKIRKSLHEADPSKYISIECRMVGLPYVKKNFMFIDDIAGQTAHILQNSKEFSGEDNKYPISKDTFHIATKYPITCEEMLNSIQKSLRVQGMRFAGHWEDILNPNPTEELIKRTIGLIYSPYFLRQEPKYETSNADLFLRGYERKEMSAEKFDRLMEQYVNNELEGILSKLAVKKSGEHKGV